MRETELSTNLSVGIAVRVRTEISAEMYNISSKVIILGLLNKAL